MRNSWHIAGTHRQVRVNSKLGGARCYRGKPFEGLCVGAALSRFESATPARFSMPSTATTPHEENSMERRCPASSPRERPGRPPKGTPVDEVSADPQGHQRETRRRLTPAQAPATRGQAPRPLAASPVAGRPKAAGGRGSPQRGLRQPRSRTLIPKQNWCRHAR